MIATSGVGYVFKFDEWKVRIAGHHRSSDINIRDLRIPLVYNSYLLVYSAYIPLRGIGLEGSEEATSAAERLYPTLRIRLAS